MSNKQQDLYIPPRPRCEEMNFSGYDEDYIITVPQGIRENSQKNAHDKFDDVQPQIIRVSMKQGEPVFTRVRRKRKEKHNG